MNKKHDEVTVGSKFDDLTQGIESQVDNQIIPHMFLVIGLIPNCAGLLGSEVSLPGVNGGSLSSSMESSVTGSTKAAGVSFRKFIWNGLPTKFSTLGLSKASSASAGLLAGNVISISFCSFSSCRTCVRFGADNFVRSFFGVLRRLVLKPGGGARRNEAGVWVPCETILGAVGGEGCGTRESLRSDPKPKSNVEWSACLEGKEPAVGEKIEPRDSACIGLISGGGGAARVGGGGLSINDGFVDLGGDDLGKSVIGEKML
jgi:hypothetical protein